MPCFDHFDVPVVRGEEDTELGRTTRQDATEELVDQLMGRNPEHRFNFIQNHASDIDRDLIDA